MELTTFISVFMGGLYIGSIYALLAVSLTILFGIAKTVNLAHGEFFTIGAYITFWLYTFFGAEPLLSLFIVPCILAGLGTILYIFGGFSNVLNRPEPKVEKELTTLIITFGLMLIITNGVAGFYSPDIQAYAYLTQTFEFVGAHFALNKILAPLISLLLIGGLWLMMKRTWFGKGLRYVLDDELSAKLVGVDVNKIYLYCFIIAFAMAGIAGSLFSMTYGIEPYMGVKFTMVAFVAIIFGGVGSVRGALVGGLFIGIVTSFICYFTSPLLDISIIYSCLIIVLLVRPKGLFLR